MVLRYTLKFFLNMGFVLKEVAAVISYKDRQCKFFKKLSEIPEEDAIVKTVIRICNDSRMIRYYQRLVSDNAERDIDERQTRILDSESSMCVYYRELDLMREANIYSTMLYDYYRITLTPWRLSNHNLAIETGRYTRPYTERRDRVCTMCNTVEDERHVIYICPRYDDLRVQHTTLVERLTTVAEFLNPNENDMKEVASFLRGIESRRKDLSL